MAWFFKSYTDSDASSSKALDLTGQCKVFDFDPKQIIPAAFSQVQNDIVKFKPIVDGNGFYSTETMKNLMTYVFMTTEEPFKKLAVEYKLKRRKSLGNLENYISLYYAFFDCGIKLLQDTEAYLFPFWHIDDETFAKSIDHHMKTPAGKDWLGLYTKLLFSAQSGGLSSQEVQDALLYVQEHLPLVLNDLAPYKSAIRENNSLASMTLLLTADRHFMQKGSAYNDIYVHQNLLSKYSLDDTSYAVLVAIMSDKQNIERNGFATKL